MTLPKVRFLAVLGLAAVTGVGFATSFTVLGNYITWLSILVAVIALGVSPFLGGVLSPKSTAIVLFPISILAGLCVAWAVYGPPSSDTEPIAFVIMITIIYGGIASVVFYVGWIAGRALVDYRDYRNTRRGL